MRSLLHPAPILVVFDFDKDLVRRFRGRKLTHTFMAKGVELGRLLVEQIRLTPEVFESPPESA
jgi:hypothetical protein